MWCVNNIVLEINYSTYSSNLQRRIGSLFSGSKYFVNKMIEIVLLLVLFLILYYCWGKLHYSSKNESLSQYQSVCTSITSSVIFNLPNTDLIGGYGPDGGIHEFNQFLMGVVFVQFNN